MTSQLELDSQELLAGWVNAGEGTGRAARCFISCCLQETANTGFLPLAKVKLAIGKSKSLPSKVEKCVDLLGFAALLPLIFQISDPPGPRVSPSAEACCLRGLRGPGGSLQAPAGLAGSSSRKVFYQLTQLSLHLSLIQNYQLRVSVVGPSVIHTPQPHHGFSISFLPLLPAHGSRCPWHFPNILSLRAFCGLTIPPLSLSQCSFLLYITEDFFSLIIRIN